ncbi:hypothetical protein [Hymenobacter wooponensis]|uniref:Uncharacterized protein n=1 Tax=Hymenobacter wooponensis TaxID=1525360 RepID=A0A4Z0MTB4_9BACT|nr:hypothetical protein [Hymenobacter wooponensis]TGD82487.1 hypothetical protein EU557_01490 [Hymenobacter wooponensis]
MVRDVWYINSGSFEQPQQFEVTPDGDAEIIFHIGGGCTVLTPDGLQPLPSPFQMGLLKDHPSPSSVA